MNQKERRAARGLQIVAVCCCFCLLAVGAGVTYRAMDREKAGGGRDLAEGTACDSGTEQNNRDCSRRSSRGKPRKQRK